MEPKLEDHFVVFVDFLGTRSAIADDETATELLNLLIELTSLRSEFKVDASPAAPDGSRRFDVRPAISTFSDHIVISYPIHPLCASGMDERGAAAMVFSQARFLLASIGAAALRLGFLIRGGATIGKLYHSAGVVFGDALVEAYTIESQTSIYPRVVVSPQVRARPNWEMVSVSVGEDGLYEMDFRRFMLMRSTRPGDRWTAQVKEWFEAVTAIIEKRLSDLKRPERLNEFAKWAWFTRHFRQGLESLGPDFLRDMGISLDKIPKVTG